MEEAIRIEVLKCQQTWQVRRTTRKPGRVNEAKRRTQLLKRLGINLINFLIKK